MQSAQKERSSKEIINYCTIFLMYNTTTIVLKNANLNTVYHKNLVKNNDQRNSSVYANNCQNIRLAALAYLRKLSYGLASTPQGSLDTMLLVSRDGTQLS